jgi:flagella basal body P-ring formation protein FlgA
MSGKTVSIVVVTSLLASIQFGRASANNKANGLQKDSALRIYLPREVTIKDDAIKLGEVSIIRGNPADAGLVAKASEIALGRISVPGQKIVVARSIVLSRLACNGIPASKVTLTGAEKVTVRQQQHIIKGKKFVELASSFLKKNPPAGSVCQMNPIRIPKDLIIPGVSKDIKLSSRLAGNNARNQSKVKIAVLADGNEIGEREVTFRFKYNCHRVVTLAELTAGTVISTKNVKIEKSVSGSPEPSGWKPPYGLITRRKLSADTVIRPGMIGPVKPSVVVERNQTVVIRIERPGLVVTAVGKAMQNGRAGEYIKVRNVDSQRIILAKVKEDGCVEPIF